MVPCWIRPPGMEMQTEGRPVGGMPLSYVCIATWSAIWWVSYIPNL